MCMLNTLTWPDLTWPALNTTLILTISLTLTLILNLTLILTVKAYGWSHLGGYFALTFIYSIISPVVIASDFRETFI